MATLTIRNVPARVVKSLKTLARRHKRSMEQEVRAVLEQHVGDRTAVLDEIEQSWARQTRRPSAREVDSWIRAGRH
jgi:plasmid stability protein